MPWHESIQQKNNQVEVNLEEVNFLKNNKILLVEDNKFNQDVMKAWFDDLGLEIHIAENGRIGVEKALSLKPDLILMDTHMPKMDGLSAIKEIRRHPEGGGIPIITVSAEAFTNQQKKAYDTGVSDYITKPVDFQKLLKIAIKYLRQVPAIPKPEGEKTQTFLPGPV